MPDPGPTDHPTAPTPTTTASTTATAPTSDAAHGIARELLGALPFGARPEALARCPRLVDRLGGPPAAVDGTAAGGRAVAAVDAAVESLTVPVHLPDRHPDPLAPALVRRMLHVLLATRDLGWPGLDAPLSVRRVAAADLFFDATQTVLTDDDWKGPHGVEFALLRHLAGRIVADAAHRHPVSVDDARAGEVGGEMLGHLHRVRRPRGL